MVINCFPVNPSVDWIFHNVIETELWIKFNTNHFKSFFKDIFFNYRFQD